MSRTRGIRRRIHSSGVARQARILSFEGGDSAIAESRHVEYVVDEPEKMFPVRENDIEFFLLFAGG